MARRFRRHGALNGWIRFAFTLGPSNAASTLSLGESNRQGAKWGRLLAPLGGTRRLGGPTPDWNAKVSRAWRRWQQLLLGA
jgi:hypothetical protein